MKFKSLVTGIAALVIAAACSATPEPSGSLLYVATRSWSNGMEERVEVFSDGKTIMTHGDYDERVTLPDEQMSELAAAAALPVDAGSNSDDPIIGVTIGGSAEVRPAALTPGSIAEMLNKLLDSHTLHE
jgi:hypothetical protein